MCSIHYIIKKILFPRKCLVCKKEGSSLCETCLSLLPLQSTRRHIEKYTEVVLFPYTHTQIARIIWELKYKNNQELRRALFTRIGPEIKNHIEFTLGTSHGKIFLITPPGSKKDSLKTRDFDHGLLLARALVPYLHTFTPVILTGFLAKKEAGRQATQKNRTSRIQQMKHALTPTTKLTGYGKHSLPLIILDDVTTTGATRDEMIRALRPYFTGTIIFIALAH